MASARMDLRPALPTVLVLAGGLGTRLRPLTHDLPKVLVPVLGRPFIDHLLQDLIRQGATRFLISVGYRAEQVEQHLGDGSRLGCQVTYVQEDTPLGTGGAILHALPRMAEESFVVVNGDTLLEVDLSGLVQHHLHAGTLATLAAVRVPDRGRYGALQVEAGRVVAFEEKRPGAGAGLINGGVCVLRRQLLDDAPAAPFSLERDLLPRHLGRIAVFETDGFFVDMGTHEALQDLDRSLARYFAGQRRT